MRILDIGAQISQSRNDRLHLIDVYPWKHTITAVNLSNKDLVVAKKRYPEISTGVADACNLPWRDKSFDIVFCNAVIEHVGNWKKQKEMAGEIMRVGKTWFVATPNRWYPFEFHLRLPLVSWLPANGCLWVSRCIRYCHLSRRYVCGSRYGWNHNGLRLMTCGELKTCFPQSRIIKQRVTFMAETLIAAGGELRNMNHISCPAARARHAAGAYRQTALHETAMEMTP